MIPAAEIRKAQAAIEGAAVRTPLLRLNAPEADAEIYLKLENLQPIGSFKIRGATNAIRQTSPDELRAGVVTASAGNMAQGVAWAAREAGVPCTVIVPDHAPQTKLDAIERLGGTIVKVTLDEWWDALTGYGMESGPAVSAALTFRLVTYWLPMLPGWFTFQQMQRREEL